MERISRIILVGIIGLSMVSCKQNTSSNLDFTALYQAQPLVYQSDSDIYIVKEKNHPQKIISGKFKHYESAAAGTDGVVTTTKGIFRISYDHKWLAFAQPDKADNDKISLQLANTDKEQVKEICDDLAYFAPATTISHNNSFKFASNGDLYYLKNNRNDITTDLYVYRNGKSSPVVSNVINFNLSGDNKKILYTSGNEYLKENKPSADTKLETFMLQWHYKYEPSTFSLSLYDIHSKKSDMISSNTEAKQYSYDMNSLSFVDYTEKDAKGAVVKNTMGRSQLMKGIALNVPVGAFILMKILIL